MIVVELKTHCTLRQLGKTNEVFRVSLNFLLAIQENITISRKYISKIWNCNLIWTIIAYKNNINITEINFSRLIKSILICKNKNKFYGENNYLKMEFMN